MKKIFALSIAMLACATFTFAQQKTDNMKVAGNCGMCKKTIEKSAKEAGATYALWNKDSKVLTVKYNSASTSKTKIEQKIAGAGYDTPDFKASEEAYSKLDGCCQYERETAATEKKMACCTEKCEMKDGKCADMAACKEKGCCKDEAACKEKGCCSKETPGTVASGGMQHGKDKMEMSDCCEKGKTATADKSKATCDKEKSCCDKTKSN